MARRILRIYGYYYPVDYGTKSKERSVLYPKSMVPDLFSVFPNPAGQQIQVHIETGTLMEESVGVRLIRPDGAIQEEKRIKISGSGDFIFNIQPLPSGIYLIQVRLDSGKVQTKRVAVIH